MLWRTERTERWRHLRPALLSLWQREKHRNSNWGVGRLPIFPADVWVYMCGHAHPHMLMQCMHVSPLSALNSVGQHYPEPSNTFTQAASAACFAYSRIFRRGLCLLYIQKTHLRVWKLQHSRTTSFAIYVLTDDDSTNVSGEPRLWV